MTHLYFKVIAQKPKTKVYSVMSNYDKSELGKVEWYPRWRQYVFSPTQDSSTVWSSGCLDELMRFVIATNKEHKQKKEPTVECNWTVFG